MEKPSRLRFSIDIGGTFTDLVVLDEATGKTIREKARTTPGNPLIGALDVIDKAKLDLTTVERFFVHGSTMASNVLLERKGAKVAFLATKGFRDIQEVGRHEREDDLYNLKYHKPPLIVPRELTFDISERMNYLGEVLVELDTQDVKRVAKILKQKKVEAVAICFLHSYRNPVHERKAKEILINEGYPENAVYISSDVANEYREYHRSMTVIINTYLAPVFETWVRGLEKEFARRGFRGEVIFTKSDGGGMTLEGVIKSPINVLLSGPCGGVIGGQFIADKCNYPNLITMDTGGTSADVAVIKGGQARTEAELTFSRYPILIPNIRIETIGAGGGSIAWIDPGGLLHMGPQSAGASPGPACYAGGGTEPTLTDAFLCNGYIDAGYFLGGEMRLDLDLAINAIKSKVGEPLNMDLYSASHGMFRISISNLAEGVRGLLAEKGDDLREFSLLCYGGASPLLGSYLIDELQIASVIIPIAPANFSAWGMLGIDLKYDLVSTLWEKLDLVSLDEVNSKFEELVKEGLDILDRDLVPTEGRRISKSIDMRYVGQMYDINVPIDFEIDDTSKPRIYEEFNKVYNTIYGYMLKTPARIVSLRVKSIGDIPKPALSYIEVGTSNADAALKGSRKVFCVMKKGFVNHNIYERSKLLANNIVMGPALIEEPTSVTNIPQGYRCEVNKFGHLIITRKGGK